jgi:hypothetical protein
MPGFNNTLKKDNSVHRFIQTTDLGAVFATSAVLPTFYARSFAYTDVIQYTSYQALFDQYKIDEIEIWMQAGQAGNNNANTYPTWYSAIDYDSDSAASALSTLQQYTNVITTPLTQGHYFRFKPHVAEALYSGAFTSYGNIKSPWIDSASPGVKHYGFTVGVNVTPAAVQMNMVIRLHFSTRNVF